MSDAIVTVFGGTGFLGRRIVQHFHDRQFGVRIASRHPDRGRTLFADDPRPQAIEADVHDDQSVADAVAGAHAVVNAVSLYVERGRETFASVHVNAARRVADQARRAGVEHLAHVSGIGADVASTSTYIRSRGEGEAAVTAAFPDAIVIRPAVMMGPDDAFLTVILRLLRRLPVYPMFGTGQTRLQPAYVNDVAEAIVRAVQRGGTGRVTYELAGPRVYSYEELLRAVARLAGLKRLLFPMPFAIWHPLARMAEMLPSPPITRNQVELMQVDNVASAGMLGFGDLGIAPRSLNDVLQLMQKR